MANAKTDLGILGLGVMGFNLALNIAEHGFAVSGFDLDASRATALAEAVAGGRATGATSLQAFLAGLRAPRSLILLVPAGPPVDAALRSLLPHLEPGDLVVDGGNSHIKDTDLRGRMLAERGVGFIGMGVSGGEEGARHGPSLMPGGPAEYYPRLQPVLQAIAARVNGEPCVAYLGPGSAGHSVKSTRGSAITLRYQSAFSPQPEAT